MTTSPKAKNAFCRLLANITVEPVIFLYTMAMFTTFPTVQALFYQKNCLILFNSTVCSSLDNATNSVELDAVQTEAAHWLMYVSVCSLLPSIFAAMFMGSWFDKISRKFTMMLPPIGLLINTIVLLICALPGNMTSPPGYVLIGSIANGLSGGLVISLSSVYSYISCISTLENRIFRIAVAESMFFFASATGAGVSGIMLRNTSFTAVFAYVAALLVVLELYIFFCINEPAFGADNGTDMKDRAGRNWCSYLFDVDHVKQSVRCLLRDWPGEQRTLLWLMAVAFGCYLMNGVGSNEIMYLFLRHDPVHWPKENAQTLYGLFTACINVSSAVGMILLISLIKRYTQLSDAGICLLGIISRIGTLVLFGLSQNTWMVFIFACLQVMCGIPSASFRGMMSKTVEPNEVGTLFAIVSAMESTAILCGSVIYNEMYPETLSFFPGFSFILAAVLLCFPAVLVIITRHILAKQKPYENLEDQSDEPSAIIGLSPAR